MKNRPPERILFSAVCAIAFLSTLSTCGGTRPFTRANLQETCTCGDPETDVLGCTAPCALGEKCDNPKCTCVHEPGKKGK